MQFRSVSKFDDIARAWCSNKSRAVKALASAEAVAAQTSQAEGARFESLSLA